MIRRFGCWEIIAFLIGYLLGWLLSTPSHAAGWDDVTVRIENRMGSIATVGSGTLVAGNGKEALVITCKHIFREGVGRLSVERSNHQRYPARLIDVSRRNDISAIEIPDPGARALRVADRQATRATLIGWGPTNRPWKQTGDLVEHAGQTAFYNFSPLEGDSGGGVFDDQGRFAGVVWGTDGENGAVVPLADLRLVLDSPACQRFWQTTSTKKEGSSMIAAPLILAAALAQAPPLPGKNAPQAVQPSPQGQVAPPQSYVPQSQAYDVPVVIRLRVIPEVEAYSPRPTPQQPVGYGGGGCYSGSYSSGFSAQTQYQSFAAPACQGAFCSGGAVRGTVGGGGGLGSPELLGLRSKTKFRFKQKIGFGGGLREMLGR